MAKRLSNKRKWIAELYKHENTVDEDDRPVSTYTLVRKVYYSSLGITSNEKYMSLQDKREIVKRIEIVMDRAITETDSRIKIGDITYQITRIWIDEHERRMELSLAHVD